MRLLDLGYARGLLGLWKRPPKKTRRVPQCTFLGEHYNLQEIYHRLNAHYFDSRLQLKITWFGSAQRRAVYRRTLGLYVFPDKLIKIHRLLDHPDFPHDFISYVVYHEMLHHVFPPVKQRRGKRKIHHRDFKEHEKKFSAYAQVKQWEKDNAQLFFQTRALAVGSARISADSIAKARTR